MPPWDVLLSIRMSYNSPKHATIQAKFARPWRGIGFGVNHQVLWRLTHQLLAGKGNVCMGSPCKQGRGDKGTALCAIPPSSQAMSGVTMLQMDGDAHAVWTYLTKYIDYLDSYSTYNQMVDRCILSNIHKSNARLFGQCSMDITYTNLVGDSQGD